MNTRTPVKRTKRWLTSQRKAFKAMHEDGAFDFAEFIDGEIILRAIPKGAELPEGSTIILDMPTKIIHQRIQRNLVLAIGAFVVKNKLGEIFDTPTDLIISGQTFQPDILFVSSEEQSVIKEFHIDGYADLVIEIFSKSTKRRDRQVKFRYYESAGIPSYWMVSPEEKEIEVYTLTKGRYDLENVYNETDTLRMDFGKNHVLKINLKKIFSSPI
jgi:Uma2 family endonuclease